MEAPTWKQITMTVDGRTIKGEYCVQGHLAKVKIGSVRRLPISEVGCGGLGP